MPRKNWLFEKLGEYSFTSGQWNKWDSMSSEEKEAYESKYENKITSEGFKRKK